MIRLKITRTWKSYRPTAQWETFDVETRFFESVREAKDWARENLPPGSRSPVYVDTVSRGTIKCGFVIGYRERNDRGEKYLARDWVSFEEVIRHPTEGKPGEVRSVAL